jgi:hypothetical protein
MGVGMLTEKPPYFETRRLHRETHTVPGKADAMLGGGLTPSSSSRINRTFFVEP